MSDNVIDFAQFRARRAARQTSAPVTPDWPQAIPPLMWMPVFFFVPVFFPYPLTETSRAG